MVQSKGELFFTGIFFQIASWETERIGKRAVVSRFCHTSLHTAPYLVRLANMAFERSDTTNQNCDIQYKVAGRYKFSRRLIILKKLNSFFNQILYYLLINELYNFFIDYSGTILQGSATWYWNRPFQFSSALARQTRMAGLSVNVEKKSIRPLLNIEICRRNDWKTWIHSREQSSTWAWSISSLRNSTVVQRKRVSIETVIAESNNKVEAES